MSSPGSLRAQGLPSQIEAAQSDAEVEKLVRGVDPYYANFTVSSTMHFANERVEKKYRQAHMKAWEKADFDGNGRVDLLVTGTHFDGKSKVVCLLDMGNGRLIAEAFPRYFHRACPLAKVSYCGTQPLITYTDFAKPFPGIDKLKGKRTFRLLYKYGGFVEYNPQATTTVVVDSISYHSIFAYHSITETRLTVGSAGQGAYYSCTYPVLEKEKKTYESLTTVVDSQTLSELRGMAGYLAGQHIKPEYSTGGNHRPSTTISIYYRGSQAIQVEDDGELGTFGLMRLYALLGQLRKSQTWQSVRP